MPVMLQSPTEVDFCRIVHPLAHHRLRHLFIKFRFIVKYY